ncbi:MAG TPA: hypothetical protein VFD19_00830 [Clostridia bacterium]|nr:hypothetical protein [Clostridia bacterium]
MAMTDDLSSGLFYDQEKLQDRLQGFEGCDGWQINGCYARKEARGLAAYEVLDREKGAYWLVTGPWREWQRVQELLSHLSWISNAMAQSSLLFRAFGPIIPATRWVSCEEGYYGFAKRRSDTPYIAMLLEQTTPKFENLVQLTAFLRLLQAGKNQLMVTGRDSVLVEMESCAQDLVASVEKRIPDRPVFKYWKSFFLRNARSIATSRNSHLTLSLGPFVSNCFAYTENGALLVDYPFFLCENIVNTDLCQLMYDLADIDVQDRYYLIDLYFNLEPPSYFFTLLAHHHMTIDLKKIVSSARGSKEEKEHINRFATLSRNHDLFRTPVPVWYK